MNMSKLQQPVKAFTGDLENSIREIDFKLMESLLLKEKISDYNAIVTKINEDWAKQLGF